MCFRSASAFPTASGLISVVIPPSWFVEINLYRRKDRRRVLYLWYLHRLNKKRFQDSKLGTRLAIWRSRKATGHKTDELSSQKVHRFKWVYVLSFLDAWLILIRLSLHGREYDLTSKGAHEKQMAINEYDSAFSYLLKERWSLAAGRGQSIGTFNCLRYTEQPAQTLERKIDQVYRYQLLFGIKNIPIGCDRRCYWIQSQRKWNV